MIFMNRAILAKLPELYWFLRYHKRNAAVRRRYYRYIAKEKKILIAAGVNAECLRRYCRALCKIHCGYARKNYEAYRKECPACR